MNIKAMLEKRAALLAELEKINATVVAETRAYTEEEETRYAEVMKEIEALDKTLDAVEKANNIAVRSAVEDIDDPAVTEERAFADYIMNGAEMRNGEQNADYTNNGAIVPTTIANRIIKKVKELSPILSRATIYNVKGTLKIPVWGKANTTHDITVGYADDFNELVADSGKFTSVDLTGNLVGCLTLIGKRLENNGSFSVVSFVVNQMAEEIAAFVEQELLVGTGATGHCTGAISTTTVKALASATAVTTDELIEAQAMIPQVYQANACWIMNKDVFTAVRKLKDGNNRYLMQDDITNEFPYRMLGKPVYVSDNMPALAAGVCGILYGDMSGLAVNIRENVSVEVLREKYATQHAIGVVAYMELDSKVQDNQRIVALKGKSG